MTDPRLQEWLLRWEEGDLSPAETEELSDLLSRNPHARHELLLHSMMTSEIGQSLGSRTRCGPEAPFHPWRRIAGIAGGAAAAGLLIVLVTSMGRPRAENPPFAVNPPLLRESPLSRKVAEPPQPDPGALVIAPKPPVGPKEPLAVVSPPEDPPPAPQVRRPPDPVLPAPPEIRPEPRPASPVDADPNRPPSSTTVPVLATLERVRGAVFVTAGGKTSPAMTAQAILAGQGLETVGPGAEVVIAYRDSTRLSLAADARVDGFAESAGGGKRITLARGSMAIDLVGQPETKPFVVETPQAEVRGQSAAYFILSCDGESTRIDVGAGKVRLARLVDGRAIDVSNGQFANMAPGSDLVAKALLRQDKKKKGKKELEFELKVNAAIQSGVNFLKEQAAQATLTNMPDGGFPVELALWALQRGGLPEADPVFQKLLQHMMTTDLQRTYRVSLQAMILEELDRVKYQNRIAQCAQFLVDNQARNGQWSYGEPVPPLEMTPTAGAKPRKEVATPGGKSDPNKTDPKEKKEKPKVVTKITLAKRRDGLAQGDNSNSQYAALGLRACHDAGILLPQEVLKRAQTWWRGAQEVTKKGEAAGWTYGEAPSPGGRTSYGSMTAGAAGSLVMYHYMLGEPWMKDDAILKGLEWMIGHFTVTENPGLGDPRKTEQYTWHYYYLYAMERLGIMYGTETLGAHDWYMEGATYLLKAQKPSGSWEGKPGEGFTSHDTCFAILFLRRATRPLIDVASVDKSFPK
jgi:ferric-dicitrate binding protein FerR (iron transport regulator)